MQPSLVARHGRLKTQPCRLPRFVKSDNGNDYLHWEFATEAGLDGFWIHRVLEQERIESHVVDPASIATSRRRRRAKTDRIDGEALLRALMAYKRGEPRVCAMDALRRGSSPALSRTQDADQ